MYIVSVQGKKHPNGSAQIVDSTGIVVASALQSEAKHAYGALTLFVNSRVKELVPGTNVETKRRPQCYGRLVK